MKNILLSISILGVLVFNTSCQKNNSTPPADVTINTPSIDTNGNISISWSQSSASGFNSYKLYRHTTSAVDASIATLISIITSNSTLSFIDSSFTNSTDYYYRIYVVSSSGTSAGSNISSVKSPSKTLVLNGDFESTNGVEPNDWTLIPNTFGNPNNAISIEKINPNSGANCLKFHHATSTGCWEQWIAQNLSLSDLEAGATYEFSCYYRSTFAGGSGKLQIRNSSMDIVLRFPAFKSDNTWRQYKATVKMPLNVGSTGPTFYVHFCNQGLNDWWIDNISFKKI